MYNLVNTSDGCFRSGILNTLGTSGGSYIYIPLLEIEVRQGKNKFIAYSNSLIESCRSLVEQFYNTQLESKYYISIFLLLIYVLQHTVLISTFYLSNFISLSPRIPHYGNWHSHFWGGVGWYYFPVLPDNMVLRLFLHSFNKFFPVILSHGFI